jgi:FixJ family two-component response regulator
VRFLQAAGHAVRAYGNAAEFLEAGLQHAPGCIVLDLQLPGLSGLELQQLVATNDDPLPIIFVSGQSEVRHSVQAMKSGAVDFLTKASDGEELLQAVTRALAHDAESRTVRARRRALGQRYESLTGRECEVLAHLISGQLNKQIGSDLGAAEPTIKIHRRRVLLKMKADSIADLVRMAAELGISSAGSVR